MRWKEFVQISLLFLLFLLSICIFKVLELDVNFIITFIMAIFTLVISIFFFIESNKIMSTIKERITEVYGEIKKIGEPVVTKDLSISPSYNYRRLISRGEEDGR